MPQKRAQQPRVSQSIANKGTPLTWKRGDFSTPQTRYNLRSKMIESFKSHAARHILAQHIYEKHFVYHIFDETGEK